MTLSKNVSGYSDRASSGPNRLSGSLLANLFARLKSLFTRSPALKPERGETLVRSHVRKKPGRDKYVTLHRQMATELGRSWPEAR